MIRLFAVLLLALASLLPATAAPNVLFIAVDDLRPELNCYGATHMVTPHIDTLASEGRLFRHHYVAVPTCGASRYALMTGLRPTTATDDNHAFVNHMPSSYPATPESWVDLLRRNGWHTVSLGKITHEPDGYQWNDNGTYDIGRYMAIVPDMRFSWNEILFGHDKWGAQRYPLFAYANGTGRVKPVSPASEIGTAGDGSSLPDDAYPDGLMANAAIEKLREFKDDNQRFCLAVGFHKPHLPFNAPKAYYDLYNPATLPDPDPLAKPIGAAVATTIQSGEITAYADRSDRAALRHAYFACVSYIDAQVGKVLAELDSLGLANNTVVVLWGDHGWCLDDYTLMGKHVVLERGVHSPLIIRVPASTGGDPFAGVPTTGVAETIDIYPTIAELCGLTPPAGPGGTSLVPLLRNPFSPGKDSAYSRYGTVTTVRSPSWRLIRSSGVNDLYDLSSHPYELRDIAAANPTVVADLAGDLTSQANRSGTTTYAGWAGGNPALADPTADADHDGSPNQFEYLAGTDPLDPASRPQLTLEWRDLSALGLTTSEPVFGFTASGAPDDIRFGPLASPDLAAWSADSMVFLDATDLGGGLTDFRFRISETAAAHHFFRLELVAD